MYFRTFFSSKHLTVSFLMDAYKLFSSSDKSIQLAGWKETEDSFTNSIILTKVDKKKSKIAVWNI
jgi:hypothetical protein